MGSFDLDSLGHTNNNDHLRLNCQIFKTTLPVHRIGYALSAFYSSPRFYFDINILFYFLFLVHNRTFSTTVVIVFSVSLSAVSFRKIYEQILDFKKESRKNLI